MTPLTHAAVGTVIFQELRRSPWGWLLAFPLAFASHYLLDAIPHFEGIVPAGNNKPSLSVTLGLGVIGTALALLLMRWNREAGRIWLVMFLWIGLGTYSFSWSRILTAGLGLGYLAWTSKSLSSSGYLLAGMMAVVPDLVPSSFHHMVSLHHALHYHYDWGSHIPLKFSIYLFPGGWPAMLRDPYYLLGYGLQGLIEGSLLLGAVYLFSREKFIRENNAG